MELPGVAEYETALSLALAVTGVRAVAIDVAALVVAPPPAGDALDRHRRTLGLVDEWERRIDERPVADALADDPTAARFWSAVRTLGAAQARAIALQSVVGLPIADIAAVLGSSPAEVESALSQAHSTVAALLGVTGAGSSLRQTTEADDLERWAP